MKTETRTEIEAAVFRKLISHLDSRKDVPLKTGNWLKEQLEVLKTYFLLIGDVRGEGYFLGVELILDPESREPAPLQANYVVERMKSRKILLSTEGRNF